MKIVIAHPNKDYADHLYALMHTYEEDAETHLCSDVYEALNQCQTAENGAVLLSEVYWDGADASELLQMHILDNPNTSAGIVSEFDISGALPEDYPIPRISGIQDTDLIAELYVTLREDLRNQQLGPYAIRGFAGQGFLGRIYNAHQTVLKRDVRITLSPVNAYPEEIERFKATSSARAGNMHPSIYAIYEELHVHQRYIIAAEPPSGPTLLQFANRGATFDDRLVAKALHTVSDVLNHLHTRGIPHTPLRPRNVTLSDNGVIKVHNTALAHGSEMPDLSKEITSLHSMVAPFIDPNQPHEPRLTELMENIQAGSTDLNTIVETAKKIDLDLAPVVNVPERTSRARATEEIKKARKTNVLYIIGGSVLSAVCLALIVILTLDKFVVVEPMKDFRDQVEISAGPAKINDDTTVNVGAFYMDRYETTIGQYKKFLDAVEGQDTAALLPPGYQGRKSSFRPLRWKEILQAIEKKQRFLGEEIHWDMPIFNIDYADAYAYARWAGKRLPTQAEWIRAASGDEHFKLPWGNEVDMTLTNTGWDVEESSKVKEAGSVDGYKGPAPVNALRKDVSPFGVIGMGGNISEWVATIEENPPKQEGKGFVHGSSYYMKNLRANNSGFEVNLDAPQSWVGLRCVSDQRVP
jgi:formylglycine-generating enzyme required for sulfatase activity